MNFTIKKIAFSILATILCINALAQQNLSFGLFGPGLDLGDRENSAIYKIMPSDGKAGIMEPGIRVGAELYATPATSFKLVQSVKIDEMEKFAFSTQIMIRFRLFKVYKHSLSFGFGPQAFYRQTWKGIDGYIDEGVYEGLNMQKKISWLSAELEYNYYINKHNDLSFSIIHLNPEAVGFAVGIKYWLTRKSNHCNTCPSFH